LIPYTTVNVAALPVSISAATAQPIQPTVAPPIQLASNGHGDSSQSIVPVPSDIISSSTTAQPHSPEPQTAPSDFVAMESIDVGFTPTASDPVQISPAQVPSHSLPDGEIDLVQLWQKLLQQLNRPSQALLSQHGQLLFFKGREAQIGIRNSSLARIAQSKLPDVEAAFLKVFNRKVGVSLQIMTAESPVVPSNAPTVATSDPLTSLPFNPDPPISAAVLAVPSILLPTRPQETVVALPPELHSSVEVESAASPTQSWETYDELTQSARNFAQFFNGAMVHLDPLDATPEVTELSSIDAALNKVEPLEWDEPELNEP
jgi:DNA polymerase III subunit gamma/tau